VAPSTRGASNKSGTEADEKIVHRGPCERSVPWNDHGFDEIAIAALSVTLTP
jgi:hypothetical protein